jgi:chorismate mutase/prephenate dehydratase
MFPHTNAKICAETYVPIAHHLVSKCKNIEAVQKVYAGPQPAAQCRRWLRTHLPNAVIEEVTPTARAVEMASEGEGSAAIANELAAERVGLPILCEHIEDNPHNRTRFLVLGYNEPSPTGRDKSSVLFNLRNRPGELYRALGAFKRHGVNLTMIESRPNPRGTFEYLFYADMQGHHRDENVQRALSSLEHYAREVVILGSYPEANL